MWRNANEYKRNDYWYCFFFFNLLEAFTNFSFFFFLIVELNKEFNYRMSEQLFNRGSFNSLQCYLLTLICL